MKIFLALISGAMLLLCGSLQAGEGDAGQWRPLWNHKDLDGWKMTGPGEFKIENGELVT